MSIQFEWNEDKANSNRIKHSISFDEAQTVFADISACIFDDEWHSSIEEHREIIIGHSLNNRILLVCFIESQEKTIRIISARKATKQEVKKYERNNPFKS